MERVFRWFIEAPSGGQSDMAALCLQTACFDLQAFGAPHDAVLRERPDYLPFQKSSLKTASNTTYFEVPIVTKPQITSHPLWLIHWYRRLSREVSQDNRAGTQYYFY